MFIALEEAEILAKDLSRDPVKHQRAAMKILEQEMKRIMRDKNIDSMRIIIASKKSNQTMVFEDVAGVKQVNLKPDPKADFVLVNSLNKPIAFFSHKSMGVKNTNQYGGISEAAEKDIFNHPETQFFLNSLVQLIESGRDFRSAYREIHDEKLILKSVFGKEYRRDGKEFGINSVHAVCHGRPFLQALPEANTFRLKFPIMWLSGETYELRRGMYRPVLSGIKKTNRSFQYQGKTYRDIRVGIAPLQIPKGRESILI